MDEESIKKLFSERNERAVEKTKTAYGRYVRTIALNILKNDATKCKNYVYLILWNNVSKDDPSDLKAYIAMIARNTALNMLKSRKAHLILDGEPSGETEAPGDVLPDENAWTGFDNREELKRFLNDFIRSLPEKRKNSILLACDKDVFQKQIYIERSKGKQAP